MSESLMIVLYWLVSGWMPLVAAAAMCIPCGIARWHAGYNELIRTIHLGCFLLMGINVVVWMFQVITTIRAVDFTDGIFRAITFVLVVGLCVAIAAGSRLSPDNVGTAAR